MKMEPCKYCDGTGKQISQKALGESLRSEREATGISVRTMACWLNISAPYLSDLERGNRAWHTERINKYRSIVKASAEKGFKFKLKPRQPRKG